MSQFICINMYEIRMNSVYRFIWFCVLIDLLICALINPRIMLCIHQTKKLTGGGRSRRLTFVKHMLKIPSNINQLPGLL